MQDQEQKSSVLPQIMMGLIGIYIGGFMTVLLDEAVLGTFFFAKHTPEWVEEAFEFVYWPLIDGLWRLFG